jgi:hypothetical protein
VALQRRLLGEVARAGDLEGVGLAGDALVQVEHRVAEVFHVHPDAVAHHQHQQHRAEQGEGEAEGSRRSSVASRALKLRSRARLKRAGRVGGRRGGFGLGRGVGGGFAAAGFAQAGDEGVFEAGRAAAPPARRGVAGQDAAGVHQRDAVAALGLVHEVGGDEDRHAVLARAG